MIEQVTDENYQNFRNLPRSVLMVSTSYCQDCRRYDPVLETLSRQMPFIDFGKIVLDKDRSSQLKKDYTDISRWILPATLLFRDQRLVMQIKGFAPYPHVASKIQENLVQGSTVFIPNGKTSVPALIKQIQGKGLYHLQLMENSPLGRIGSTISLPEGKFDWGLESRV
jgi:thiol-disulfide isomerase/thioredoxin